MRRYFSGPHGGRIGGLALGVAAALLLLRGAAGAAAGGTDSTAGAVIEIRNFQFEPAETRVAAGTTVTWVNRDEEPHALFFADGAPASKALDTDERFSRRFDGPGRFSYRCALHPQMAGEVVVQ